MRYLKGSRPANQSLAVINTGYTQQWSGYGMCYFANVAKGGFQDFSAGTTDSNGDLATMTVGGTVSRSIWNAYGANTVVGVQTGEILTYIKTGNYIIKWNGDDVPVVAAVFGSGLATGLTQLGPRRWQVTLAQTAESGGLQEFRIHWQNTGGTTTCRIQQLVVCHSDHEAWINGGGITNPDYIAAVGRIKIFRPMTAYCVNNSLVSTNADVAQESWNGWSVYADPPNTTGLPYTAACKMAMEMQCDIWINTPYQMTSQAELNTLAANIWATPGLAASSIKIVCEYSNENWGSFPAHFNFLNNTYGPANGLTSWEAEAQLCLKVAKAFLNAGVPRNRLIINISTQTGGAWGVGSYNRGLLTAVDTTNIIGTGGTQQLWQLVDRISGAAYIAPALDTTADGSTYLFHQRLINRIPEASFAQIDTWYANAITVTSGWLDSMKSLLTSLGYTGTRGGYEGGNQAGIGAGGLAGCSYRGNINITNNTLTWDTAWQGELPTLTNGDAYYFIGGGSSGFGNGPNTTIATRSTLVYARIVDSSNVRFYTTFAGATASYADDAAAKAASLTLNDANLNAPYWVFNCTRCVATLKRLNQYLDSANGAAMYQSLVAAHTSNGRLQDFAFFQDFGYTMDVPNAGTASTYGAKRTLYAPDTARWSYIANY